MVLCVGSPDGGHCCLLNPDGCRASLDAGYGQAACLYQKLDCTGEPVGPYVSGDDPRLPCTVYPHWCRPGERLSIGPRQYQTNCT